MRNQKAMQVLQEGIIASLQKEVIALKRQIQDLTKELKASDEAIFAVIQTSTIMPLGKVTDSVMRRCAEYSSLIGETQVVKFTKTATKRKPRK